MGPGRIDTDPEKGPKRTCEQPEKVKEREARYENHDNRGYKETKLRARQHQSRAPRQQCSWAGREKKLS